MYNMTPRIQNAQSLFYNDFSSVGRGNQTSINDLSPIIKYHRHSKIRLKLYHHWSYRLKYINTHYCKHICLTNTLNPEYNLVYTLTLFFVPRLWIYWFFFHLIRKYVIRLIRPSRPLNHKSYNQVYVLLFQKQLSYWLLNHLLGFFWVFSCISGKVDKFVILESQLGR